MKKSISAVFVLILLLSKPVFCAQKANEDDIKTAYIYNFVRYVTWEEEEAKFTLCVHDKSKLFFPLQRLKGKAVRNSLIEVLLIHNTKEARSCHTLILPTMKNSQLQKFIAFAKTHTILTISDTKGYAQKGVMINFVKSQNKISFEVNLRQLKNSNLEINANLLHLSQHVYQ